MHKRLSGLWTAPAFLVFLVAVVSACAGDPPPDDSDTAPAVPGQASGEPQTSLIQLWSAEQPAFGIFVPSERPRDERAADGSRLPAMYSVEGGVALAQNELLDYLFLSLEGNYEAEAVSTIAEGVARAGVPVPPTLMIEDPDALAAVREISDTPGYSVLACGIGSLTNALGGDRAAGEAGNSEVLVHAMRVGAPDIITANAEDVARRIEEGFLGLLMSGPTADDAIRRGLAAAGR